MRRALAALALLVPWSLAADPLPHASSLPDRIAHPLEQGLRDLRRQLASPIPTEVETDEDLEPALPTFHEEPRPGPAPSTLVPFLPVGGESLREQGFDLPLPIGLSTTYLHLRRDIDVEDMKIKIDDGAWRTLNDFVQVDSNSAVDVVIGRLDVWLLPFLNVYGYGGWQWNDSEVGVDVTVPGPGPGGGHAFRVDDDGEIDGPIYGAGISLAGGYEELFLSANVDFAFAEFDEFDSRFEGQIYGLRGGWAGEIREIAARVWTGFNYYATNTTIDGSVNVPGVGRVRFEVDQGPDNPWNGLLGFGIGAFDHFEANAEYGFNFDDIHIFMGGLTLRF